MKVLKVKEWLKLHSLNYKLKELQDIEEELGAKFKSSPLSVGDLRLQTDILKKKFKILEDATNVIKEVYDKRRN